MPIRKVLHSSGRWGRFALAGLFMVGIALVVATAFAWQNPEPAADDQPPVRSGGLRELDGDEDSPLKPVAEPARAPVIQAGPIPKSGGAPRLGTLPKAGADAAPIPVPAMRHTSPDPSDESVPSDPPADEPQSAAASFRGVQPGVTTADDLNNAWGRPQQTNTDGGVTRHLFSMESFSHVEVVLQRDVVTSIIILLDKPVSPEAIAAQLKFDSSRAVTVENPHGDPLGQAYPERGVLLTFSPTAMTPQVAQIVIESPSAESFLLRARVNHRHQYRERLADLDSALRLDANNADAHHLRARTLLEVGRLDEAAKALAEALLPEPDQVEYLLTQGEILQAAGQYDRAAGQTRAVLAAENLPAIVKARAWCRLGDQLADGPQRDYHEAIKHHLAAIKIADTLSVSRKVELRRSAKRLLVDANLGVARDVAWGNWREKSQVLPKWLDRASGHAEDLIKNEQGDPQLRLAVMQAALSASVATQGQFDSTPWTADALSVARQIMQQTDDPLRQGRVNWLLGTLLYDAVQVGHARKEYTGTLQLSKLAVANLEAARAARQSTPESDYVLGRLYYRIGVIHAVGKKDHLAAVSWYEKALPRLSGEIPPSARVHAGERGETLVSLGVSYWEVGQHKKAIELTTEGAELVKQAVEQGRFEQSALRVPYANLAGMHRDEGDEQQAATYAELARNIPAGDSPRR